MQLYLLDNLNHTTIFYFYHVFVIAFNVQIKRIKSEMTAVTQGFKGFSLSRLVTYGSVTWLVKV